MTQWIRPWGVVILLVLILGTVLFANSLLKHFIITRGTELNGAKVELESLNLDLWPATLELRGFRVTDAQNPMVNLIDIGWIKLHLDGVMPIQKPLIIDRLELSQLQINSPRNDSGVLDKKSPNRRPEYDFTAVLPNLSMDDMVPMLSVAEQQIMVEISSTQQQIQLVKSRWEANIEQLPSEDKLAEYQARWKRLSNASFIQKLQGLKALKDDLAKDIDFMQSLETQLQEDQLKVERSLADIRALPAEMAELLIKNAGLSVDNIQFAKRVLGKQIDRWLAGVQMAVGGASGNGEKMALKRGQGRLVNFREKSSSPKLLLREAVFSGYLLLADSELLLEGSLTNIGYPLNAVDEPASLEINAQGEADEQLIFSAVLSHDKGVAQSQFNLDMKNVAFSNTTLAVLPNISFWLSEGSLDLSARGSVSTTAIDSYIMASLRDARIEIDQKVAGKTEQMIVEAFNAINQGDLDVTLSGALDNPSVRVSSNVDKIVGAVLASELDGQLSQLKRSLTNVLITQVESSFEELGSQGDFLVDLQVLLKERQQAIPRI
jgi:uncharacterized protein (TIGR03545 family)